MPMDQAKLDEFMGKLLHDMGAAATGAPLADCAAVFSGGRQRGSPARLARVTSDSDAVGLGFRNFAGSQPRRAVDGSRTRQAQ